MPTRTDDAPSTLRHTWLADAAPQALLRADGPDAAFQALRAGLPGARPFLWLKDPAGPDARLGNAPGDRAGWNACRRALASGWPVEGPGLALPLATDGDAFGVLYVDADFARARALAPVAAAAVELARLRVTHQRQTQELAEALDKYRQAARDASTDALTGLANRRSFLEHAERQTAIATRYGATYAVLLIDVDRFKACNDRYGHAAGDLVLKLVAEVLGRSIRQPDLAARYGGEEFVILCPNTDARKAALLAERVRRAIAGALPQASPEVPVPPPGVTASVGVATFRPGDAHVAAVIDRADRALYRAKRAGRDRVVVADAADA
jgi:diguanylate cyclase (GGDEF)-like protein